MAAMPSMHELMHDDAKQRKQGKDPISGKKMDAVLVHQKQTRHCEGNNEDHAHT
jgi:hypothetical protein